MCLAVGHARQQLLMHLSVWLLRDCLCDMQGHCQGTGQQGGHSQPSKKCKSRQNRNIARTLAIRLPACLSACQPASPRTSLPARPPFRQLGTRSPACLPLHFFVGPSWAVLGISKHLLCVEPLFCRHLCGNAFTGESGSPLRRLSCASLHVVPSADMCRPLLVQNFHPQPVMLDIQVAFLLGGALRGPFPPS